MALGDSMNDRGPHLRYARVEDVVQHGTLTSALELARKIEELLEDTRSLMPPPPGPQVHDPRAHSTRMARAMAASLVDELEALVAPARSTGTS